MFDVRAFSDRYKVVRDECGDYQIKTRMKARRKSDLPMTVWACNDTHLAAYVPGMGLAKRIVGNFPQVEIVGDCTECAEIRFSVGLLDDLAGPLKLVKRRKLSEDSKKKALEGLAKAWASRTPSFGKAEPTQNRGV